MKLKFVNKTKFEFAVNLINKWHSEGEYDKNEMPIFDEINLEFIFNDNVIANSVISQFGNCGLSPIDFNIGWVYLPKSFDIIER